MTTATEPANRLEALAGMTQEADAANPSAEQQQATATQQAQISEAEAGARQWGILMFTIGGFAQMIAPELKPVYSEERCYAWGQTANEVSKKYGWDGPSAMPELALIASTAGFFVPTWLVVRGKMDQAKAAKDGSISEKISLWFASRKAKAKRAAARANAAEPTDTAGAPDGSQ